MLHSTGPAAKPFTAAARIIAMLNSAIDFMVLHVISQTPYLLLPRADIYPAAGRVSGYSKVVRVKIRVHTVIRMNVEHRTSNIERPILMALRFIYFKTNEPR